jgi:hypothetical protein
MAKIKPSQLTPFDKIPKGQKVNTELIPSKNYVCSDWYHYYKVVDTWMPHRKPTVQEIIKDQFNN